MAERRTDARMACYLRGEIVLNDGQVVLPCEVHDISERGMRLAGVDPIRLPDIFMLHVARRKMSERVRVVRRGPGDVGVIIIRAAGLPEADEAAISSRGGPGRGKASRPPWRNR